MINKQTLHLVNIYDVVHFCDNVKIEHKKVMMLHYY